MSGATVKATLSARNQAEQIEARLGNVVTEWTYTGYDDWNGQDLLADALFPNHIVQKRGGVTMLDLMVTKTDTINPYVIMPVPENVEKAVATR